jgi:hypothetical protein
MLRSGGVPAWLQLLGAPGNRNCAQAKAFGRIRLAATGQRRRGGQMLGGLEGFAFGMIETVNDHRVC